ncbi:MAG: hypothetical protein HY298_22985 [Verrucomicrobia bacterium]|nr:hypothetical protein [Verrucomicrobiota bacterium]
MSTEVASETYTWQEAGYRGSVFCSRSLGIVAATQRVLVVALPHRSVNRYDCTPPQWER